MRSKLTTEGKKVIEDTVTTLPQNPDDVPDEFYSILSDEIAYNILAQITENRPSISPSQIKDGRYRYSAVLEDLERLKNQLGGSSAFKNKLPSINDEDCNKIFLGVPISAVKDWFRKILKDGWSPKFFWSKLASCFGVSQKDMSQYEEAHIRIQRFGILIENREYFQDILDRKEETAYGDLCKFTGLAWHPTQNGVGTEKMYMEFIDQFLTEYYEDAKSKGDDALVEFFNAFEGVCFEDRARKLEAYAMKHPLSQNVKALAEVVQVADWSSSNKFEDVCMKEVTALALEIGTTPYVSQLKERLEKKKVFETEFATDSGIKIKPTEEQFISWVEIAIDVYMILESDAGESFKVCK